MAIYSNRHVNNTSQFTARCLEVELQQVLQSEYMRQYGQLPPVLAKVEVVPTIQNGRLLVRLQQTKETIGLLPYSHQQLYTQLMQGQAVTGHILLSEHVKYSKVVVTFDGQ